MKDNKIIIIMSCFQIKSMIYKGKFCNGFSEIFQKDKIN